MAGQSATSRHHLKDKKILIATETLTYDEDRVAHKELRAIAPPLWAYVRQQSGNLNYRDAGSTYTDWDTVFFVNWKADLATAEAAKYTIGYAGNVYTVTRIDTYEGYKRDLEIYGQRDWSRKVADIKPYAATTSAGQ